MKNRCRIVLDLGTSSVKYGAVNEAGTVLFYGALPIRFTASRNKWETDMEELFMNTINAVSDVVKEARSQGYGCDAILIASQANTFVAVDGDSRALAPGIVWIDGRAEAEAELLKKEFPDFRDWSGIFEVRPTHYIAKLLWMRKNMPGLFEKSLYFPLINEYFALKLTGRYFSDYSNRGMSGMFDIHRLTVPEEMVRFLELADTSQPETGPSCGIAYPLKPEIADTLGLPDETRVLLAGNDQSSSAVGAGVRAPGTLSVTFGTAQSFYSLVEHITSSLTGGMGRGEACGRSPIEPYFFHVKFEENCGLLLERVKESCFPDRSYDELFETYRQRHIKSKEYYRAYEKRTGLNDSTAGDIESVIDYILSVFLTNLRLFESSHPVETIVISGGLSQSPIWQGILTEIVDRRITEAEDRRGALVGAALIFQYHIAKS